MSLAEGPGWSPSRRWRAQRRRLAPSSLVCALAGPLLLGATACDPEESATQPPPTERESDAPPLPSSPGDAIAVPVPPRLVPRCSSEMVLVGERSCVDRYEATLVDTATKTRLSPYYPPTRRKATYLADLWEGQRASTGNEKARAMPMPLLPPWQRAREIEPEARSEAGVIPSAYVSGVEATAACLNAGKRLCREDEWRLACRGERDQAFPYGDTYEAGKCNIFREGHPGVELFDNPSVNHTDPRLNLVAIGGKPLLRRAGATPSCASRWGDDAIFDMVGNLDEWIEDEEGTFVGGFYSRAKKDGCASTVRSHGLSYADYSTGFRCCADATMVAENALPPEPEKAL